MAETKRGVVIRLSTEGAEQVKAALKALGADGEASLRRLERVSSPVTRSLAGIEAGVRVLKASMVGLIGVMSIERVATGFHARVVQHEVDHLLGKLYPMRVRDFSRFGYTEVLFPGLDAADDD